MTIISVAARGLGLGVILGFAVGCAGEVSRPAVEGKVTYKGAPVADKTISLVKGAPPDIVSKTFSLGPDGTFTGEVPEPGDYKVVIGESLAVMEGGKSKAATGGKVPAKYAQAATSDVTWAVKTGSNKREIELKD
ncbi:hypothetical protein [Fimbriiglobus ruber]|uniref:Carboxypeptidase regulatory-like domain-containing protein n=1 Tax=Fimbriiglobus ruber TaxID=1908690 RepID=A0A225DNV5_9BACT|nr:hypothetical protein [Fimbriiglobus ruber]OWK38035.1 hypothetical protein FRUB_07155 [Fimbriiglobus ruber]